MDEIFVLKDDTDIQKIINTNHCYIIAKNGIFYKDFQEYMDTVIPVDEVHHLKNLKSFITWRYPKLNKHQFASILKFFKLVNDKHKAECMVLIGFDRKQKQIVIFPPNKQIVSAAHINYKHGKTPGISLIGTIHSHNTMGAFHSSTDIKDEMDFDGLHITLGKLTNTDDSFQISCQLVAGAVRQDIKYHEVIDGIVEKMEEKNQSDLQKPTIIHNMLSNFNLFYQKFIYKTPIVKKPEKKLYSEMPTNTLSNDFNKIIDTWMQTVVVQHTTLSSTTTDILSSHGCYNYYDNFKKYKNDSFIKKENRIFDKEKLFEEKVEFVDSFFLDDDEDEQDELIMNLIESGVIVDEEDLNFIQQKIDEEDLDFIQQKIDEAEEIISDENTQNSMGDAEITNPYFLKIKNKHNA